MSRHRKRGYNLRTRYGINEVDYYARWDAQGGRCAICGTTDCQPLHVDHCHQSGKVRGLLCSRCNVGIGQLGDNPAITEVATQYLNFYGHSQSDHSPERFFAWPHQGDAFRRGDTARSEI